LFSAGVDRILKHPLFLETNIPFSNCSGVHGPQISEWVIMTLLVQGHRYNAMYDAQKEHKWTREVAQGTRDLIGQRIGVLGYGAIGRQGKWYLLRYNYVWHRLRASAYNYA
jgi:phosphoglycerate dehydrogenase-like enzyme